MVVTVRARYLGAVRDLPGSWKDDQVEKSRTRILKVGQDFELAITSKLDTR